MWSLQINDPDSGLWMVSEHIWWVVLFVRILVFFNVHLVCRSVTVSPQSCAPALAWTRRWQVGTRVIVTPGLNFIHFMTLIKGKLLSLPTTFQVCFRHFLKFWGTASATKRFCSFSTVEQKHLWPACMCFGPLCCRDVALEACCWPACDDLRRLHCHAGMQHRQRAAGWDLPPGGGQVRPWNCSLILPLMRLD